MEVPWRDEAVTKSHGQRRASVWRALWGGTVLILCSNASQMVFSGAWDVRHAPKEISVLISSGDATRSIMV